MRVGNPHPTQSLRLTVEGPSGARHAGPFSRLVECGLIRPGATIRQALFAGQRIVIEAV